MSAHRVVLAMSGGVDSSVCAALLKEQGLEVIGVTMQVWERAESGASCCGISHIEDAKKVAFKLNIPHYVLNFRDQFQKKVVANFCAEYNSGKTPNPCISCNQYIKFDLLWQKAKQLGADYIATGHYARIEFDQQKEQYLLRQGIDSQKDQSYVLYMLSQAQLKHILMPLGTFAKTDVRKIAGQIDLAVAEKAESQEICFVSDRSYAEFIREHSPEAVKPGPIKNKAGKIIGEHQGIAFFTIGQRKGIGIAATRPLYVIAIDQQNNAVIVGEKEDGYSNNLIAEKVHFVYRDKLKTSQKVTAKIRYLHPPAQATIIPLDKQAVQVKFVQAQWACTPGQAVVFYQGDTVLGGGTISSNFSRN